MVRLWTAGLLFAAVALISTSSFGIFCLAGERPLAGSVVSVNGKPIATFKGEPSRELRAGSPVHVGDVITTRSDSLKILLLDKSILDIGPTAQFRVTSFKDPASDEREADLQMGYGKIRVAVAKKLKGKAKFQIRTSTATLGVRGTEFIVSQPPKSAAGNAPAPKTEVLVLQGRVDLSQNITRALAAAGAKPQVVSLVAGQRAVANPLNAAELKPVQLNAQDVSQAASSARVDDNTFKKSVSVDASESRKPELAQSFTNTVAVTVPPQAPKTEEKPSVQALGFEGTFGAEQALIPPPVLVPPGGLKRVQVVLTP